MGVSPDSLIPVGRRHRTLCDVEMLVYDYDRGVATVVLPGGSIFQPWEPHDHWRGQKVPITLGGLDSGFDWGVSSGEGHFLHWDDFFTNCELAEGSVAPLVNAGEREESQPKEELQPKSDEAEDLSPSSTKPTGAKSTNDLFDQDARGRTRLFYAAEKGLLREVEEMIFSLPGTGFYPQRLGFIEIKDNDGLTAADVAEQNGHKEIAELLRYQIWHMENFG